MPRNSKRLLLVGLDLSPMDKYLLSFLKQNHHVFTSEKVHFIHVDEHTNSESKDIFNKVSEEIKKTFPEKAIEYDLHVQSGDPEDEIRHWSDKHGIDLLLVGQKQTDDHEVEPKRLVRKPFRSLLLIPKKEDYDIKKIGVPIDFSRLSEMAIKQAADLAGSVGAELIGFHSYQVPSGYHKTGKDYDEFAEVMKNNAKDDLDKFLKKTGIKDIKVEYMHDADGRPAKCIADFVQANAIDLLVMGSKGRTEAASVILDSVAKEVTQLIRDIPLLIRKEKEDTMGLLDALKNV